MIALSLWQPWATLLVIGAKRFETRGRYTHHRGRLLIHAAKNASSKNLVDSEPFKSLLAASGIRNWDDLPLGAIVGEAALIGCCKTDLLLSHLSDTERRLGDFGPGRYGWEMQDPQKFHNPIPYRGLQGFFHVEGFDPIPVT